MPILPLKFPIMHHLPLSFRFCLRLYSLQISAVYRVIYITKLSPGWWSSNWKLLLIIAPEYITHFYFYSSMHRWSILITVQPNATQSSLFIILQIHCTCFGCYTHPSSGVHKTVTTASDTVQLPPSNMALAWPRWRAVAAQKKIWRLPEAVVTVWCNPDDGCGRHPKNVEWTFRIINRLLCVASLWTIINMKF